MNVNQMFPSKYIAASDLAGQTVPVVIAHCTLEELDDGDKPVLFFQCRTKGLVLNKTNATVLAGAFGDETDHWAGKAVELYSELVNFKGKMVQGVRLRITNTAPAPVVPLGPQAASVVTQSAPQPTTPSF